MKPTSLTTFKQEHTTKMPVFQRFPLYYYWSRVMSEMMENFADKEEAAKKMAIYQKYTFKAGCRWGQNWFKPPPSAGRKNYHYYNPYCGDKYFTCVYGVLNEHKSLEIDGHPYFNRPYEYYNRREKCGIEIMFKQFTDLRLGGSQYTVKELKGFCKTNKIKGYTKMKKQQIITALMAI